MSLCVLTDITEGGSVPPHAIAARYDCNDKLKPCHKGTRADILSLIDRWVELGDVIPPGPDGPGEDNLHTARIFWINGPGSAGTGKSTIAYTVARKLDEQRKLGASFFCSRDNADCSNRKLIIPTIAYQLGLFYPPLQKEISAVLRVDPEVAYSIIPRQLEKLLVKPLQTLTLGMPFCVVVIDALDECQDGGATSTILSSLAQCITMLSPIKFLITSRPEPPIISAFNLTRLSHTTKRCILHFVEQKVVETDILLYLHSSLQLTKQMYGLDVHWPSVKDLQTLVNLSSGLFIFAATAARFIQDRCYNDPQGQLARILNAMTVADPTPYGLLDQLYLQVLNNAYPNISPGFASRLRIVLGSLVLLYNPLSLADLEQLLQVPIPLGVTLQHLQSVVVVPSDRNQAIRLIHPSFYDFLTDPSRCLNPKFLIKSDMQHSILAQACLDAMNVLTQDMCNIKQPWKHHHELDNLSKLVEKNIPPYLQYACQHWSQHLSHALLSNKLLDAIKNFCNNYLLYWVEVSSLLGNLQGTLVALKTVHKLLSVCLHLYISAYV